MGNSSSNNDQTEDSSNTTEDNEMIEVSSPIELAYGVINNITTATDEISVLGNFIFVGEIIDSDGDPRLIFVTSDNLPEWVARGMLSTAEDMLYNGFGEE